MKLILSSRFTAIKKIPGVSVILSVAKDLVLRFFPTQLRSAKQNRVGQNDVCGVALKKFAVAGVLWGVLALPLAGFAAGSAESSKSDPSAKSSEAQTSEKTSVVQPSAAVAPAKVPEKTSPVPAKRPEPIKDFFDRSQGKVEAVADSLEYDKDTRKLIARGNAVITYQNVKMLADYAEVDSDAKKAYAKGHVMIFKTGEPRLQGEEVYYDFGNHTGSFPDARSISEPFYARGKDVQQIREGVTKIREGGITTCNLEKPHYELRAKKATLYADQKVNMYGVTIYVLGKPVFWWPFMSVPINWPNIPLQVAAGYNTRFGAYIELTKGITINQYLWGRAHVDWRAKRGIGGGWDQYYDFNKLGHGNIKLYVTQDKKAPTPGDFYQVQDDSFDPFATTEDRTRGRISWRHRTDIDENTNVILRYDRLADEYFLQEFFEKEYRSETELHSFVTATHNTERYGIMAHVTKRMNSFESLVERLPEVRLDWKNQPFFTDKVYNESRVQFDSLTMRYKRLTKKQSAVRTDAYSNWYAPLKWQEIKLLPFVGYRGTEYSQQATKDSAAYRNVVAYGADLRTQVYKTFDVSFDKMGIEVNQLRHIAEPVVRLEGSQTSVNMNRLTRFDTVDAIDDSNEVAMGLENRLQTKRIVGGKPKRVDIVSLNTYLYYAVNPVDPTIGKNQFTDLKGDLTLRPYEWLQVQTRVDYNFAWTDFRYINQDFMIRKGKWKFLFGFRYTGGYYDWYSEETIEQSTQFVFDTRYKINPLWDVGGYIRWDTETGNLGEWQVSASRDLHDFILDFGYNVRNSLINDYNNELFFNFRMKAFPSYAISGGGGRAEFSEPRIGETVAGANEGAGRLATVTDNQLASLRA
ncbi:MAG TPA: LPS assembly protein LptD [Candidatus Omnitrophota bacterium]|nr:LPS assembly protein LptD [Candidatus Omnitrophota bacterium]